MSDAWETAIFWFVFAVISSWILRRFYFPKYIELQEHLRVVASMIEMATIGLFFFPWLPTMQGGFSGWQMILRGNIGMISLFVLLLVSIALFLTKSYNLFKIGAVLHVAATILIFAVMIQALPGTIQLVFRDIAPIIAAFLLVVNTLVVLLLWNQLQKRDKLKIL